MLKKYLTQLEQTLNHRITAINTAVNQNMAEGRKTGILLNYTGMAKQIERLIVAQTQLNLVVRVIRLDKDAESLTRWLKVHKETQKEALTWVGLSKTTSAELRASIHVINDILDELAEATQWNA